MFTNPKQSIKKIVLLSIGTVIISGSTMFIFSVLGNLCSQVITSAVIYYNAMLREQLTIP